MGIPQPPPPCKLIAGLLGAADGLLDEAALALADRFGPIDGRSEATAWIATSYYANEMGTAVRRQFLSFERLVPPDELVGIKHTTNALEATWGGPNQRRVNIDPGYLTATKLVLASTKDAAHRVYLGSGIYAEVTLEFQHGSFRAGPHTYPDYAAPEVLAFFTAVRAAHLRARRGATTCR